MSGSNVLDERFLYLLALSAASNREPALFIVDCRPQTSALGTAATDAVIVYVLLIDTLTNYTAYSIIYFINPFCTIFSEQSDWSRV